MNGSPGFNRSNERRKIEPMNYRNPKLWIVGIFIILVITFLLQNLQPVYITFLVWSGGISTALLMVILLIAGIFLGILGRGIYRRRRSRRF